MYAQSLYKSIYRIQETEERCRFLVQQIEQMTGLKNLGAYLGRLLTIDALFLNEDRHTHNIAVLCDDLGEFHSLHFSFHEHTIDELLEKEQYYSDEIKARVKQILLQQRRKYQYLFR